MEAAGTQETEEITEEIETPEVSEETELDTDNADVEAEGVEDEEGEADPKIEAWMSEEAEGEEEAGDSEKPIKYLKAKKKLKGKISDLDTENERLKAKIEELQSAPATQQADPISYGLKRPDELDFERTEDYHKALDNYYINLANADRQKSEQEREYEAKKAERKKGVDDHYSRAEKLIDKSGIAPEKYQEADLKFRESVDKVSKGNGDEIVDILISSLGEGSEKVGYFIGNNEAARAKLQSLFVEDPSGLKAAAYLGAENQRLKEPKKRVSKARSPATKIKGDVNSGSSEKKLKRKYDDAHKKGDYDSAWNFKKAAKKAGINTKDWAKG